MSAFQKQLAEASAYARTNGELDFKLRAMGALQAAGMLQAARLVGRLDIDGVTAPAPVSPGIDRTVTP